jgi:hypothetical protein
MGVHKMSSLTHLILTTNADIDSEPLRRLRAWCVEHADGQTLELISTAAAGGHKVFCDDVYMCCGNYFPLEAFLKALPTFGWDEYDAERTVLLVTSENVKDDVPFLIRANGQTV